MLAKYTSGTYGSTDTAQGQNQPLDPNVGKPGIVEQSTPTPSQPVHQPPSQPRALAPRPEAKT
eukprot:2823964-Pyramimonas_sp.AAC.1